MSITISKFVKCHMKKFCWHNEQITSNTKSWGEISQWESTKNELGAFRLLVLWTADINQTSTSHISSICCRYVFVNYFHTVTMFRSILSSQFNLDTRFDLHRAVTGIKWTIENRNSNFQTTNNDLVIYILIISCRALCRQPMDCSPLDKV